MNLGKLRQNAAIAECRTLRFIKLAPNSCTHVLTHHALFGAKLDVCPAARLNVLLQLGKGFLALGLQPE